MSLQSRDVKQLEAKIKADPKSANGMYEIHIIARIIRNTKIRTLQNCQKL